MALNSYLQQAQRLLGDTAQLQFDLGSLTTYVNMAREQVALEGQCIRILPNSSLTANQTVVGQEIYLFSAIDLTGNPGVASVLNIRGISLLWGNQRFTMLKNGFSKHTALIRTYPNSCPDVPSAWAQFGQGQQGSLYVYPIPNSAYPLEYDCTCLPIALLDDTTVEAIPTPWTTAIPYFVAYLGMSEKAGRETNPELMVAYIKAADRHFSLYSKFMQRARAFTQTNSVSNWYGRGV